MKTYGVGLYKVGVYETRDPHPHDAVAVVANEAVICFVDRVADLSGIIDASAMTEAAARHFRLKIAALGDFELCFNDPFIGDPPHLAEHLHAWHPQRQGTFMKHLHGVSGSSRKSHQTLTLMARSFFDCAANWNPISHR